MPVADPLAVVAGAIRLSSGVSFIVAPGPAAALWGADPADSPEVAILHRSMGYRDALVGAMLLRSGLTGRGPVAGWFLASAGADLADLVGGLSVHDRLSGKAKAVGLGGAVVGIAVGTAGALRARGRGRERQ